MMSSRTSAHICDSLMDIEEQLTDRARLWAEVETGDGDRAFVVTCGDDPADEPDGPCIVVGVTRVYCSDGIAASVIGALVGESVDESES